MTMRIAHSDIPLLTLLCNDLEAALLERNIHYNSLEGVILSAEDVPEEESRVRAVALLRLGCPRPHTLTYMKVYGKHFLQLASSGGSFGDSWKLGLDTQGHRTFTEAWDTLAANWKTESLREKEWLDRAQRNLNAS